MPPVDVILLRRKLNLLLHDHTKFKMSCVHDCYLGLIAKRDEKKDALSDAEMFIFIANFFLCHQDLRPVEVEKEKLQKNVIPVNIVYKHFIEEFAKTYEFIVFLSYNAVTKYYYLQLQRDPVKSDVEEGSPSTTPPVTSPPRKKANLGTSVYKSLKFESDDFPCLLDEWKNVDLSKLMLILGDIDDELSKMCRIPLPIPSAKAIREAKDEAALNKLVADTAAPGN